jgi:hypothetical protein
MFVQRFSTRSTYCGTSRKCRIYSGALATDLSISKLNKCINYLCTYDLYGPI